MPIPSCEPCCDPVVHARTVDSHRSAELIILCDILNNIPTLEVILVSDNLWTGTNRFFANWSSCSLTGTRFEVGVFTSNDKWFQISYNICGQNLTAASYFFTGGGGDLTTPFEFSTLIVGDSGFLSDNPTSGQHLTLGPNIFSGGAGVSPYGFEVRNPDVQDIPGGVFALTGQSAVGIGYNSAFLGGADLSGTNIGGSFLIDYIGAVASQFSAVPGLKIIIEDNKFAGSYLIAAQAISDINGYGYIDCPSGLIVDDDMSGSNNYTALGRQAFVNRGIKFDTGVELKGLIASGTGVTAGFFITSEKYYFLGINADEVGDVNGSVQAGTVRFSIDALEPIFSIYWKDVLASTTNFPVMQVSSVDGAIALGTGHPDNTNVPLGCVHIVPYKTSDKVLVVQNQLSSGSSTDLTRWLAKDGATSASVSQTGNLTSKHLKSTYYRWNGQSRLSNNFTKTSSTTLSSTGMSITVSAGKKYYIEAYLYVSPSAAGGHKYSLSSAILTTGLIYQINSIRLDTNAFVINSRQTVFGVGVGATGGTSILTIIKGTVVTGSGGAIAINFAQNVASGSSSVLAGSTLKIIEYP